VHRLSIGIHQLHTKLLEMGELVELSLTRSVRALSERDHKIAEQVLNDERRINRLEIEIDDMTIGLLALHQPVARDLRFITASFKINTDLERIGDLAVTIARRAISLMTVPEDTCVAGTLQTMAGLVISMLSRSLSSYLEGDAQLAREVLAADDAVDRLRDTTNSELIDIMQSEPARVAASVDLLFVSRTLERIADHATNIAEDVVFLVSGEDVRHRGRKVA
jgi:phosphate transport system protein